MPPKDIVACLPLAAGFLLISMAILPSTCFGSGAFVLEWVGSLLIFYGLSYMAGSIPCMSLAGAVLVAGVIGDIKLLGGASPIDWAITNYMVFVHSVLGSFAGPLVRRDP